MRFGLVQGWETMAAGVGSSATVGMGGATVAGVVSDTNTAFAARATISTTDLMKLPILFFFLLD